MLVTEEETRTGLLIYRGGKSCQKPPDTSTDNKGYPFSVSLLLITRIEVYDSYGTQEKILIKVPRNILSLIYGFCYEFA